MAALELPPLPCRRDILDWFQRITGFAETTYWSTRDRLRVDRGRIVSVADGRGWGFGSLSLPSLAELRARVNSARLPKGRMSVRCVSGDAGVLHGLPQHRNALFQVASQFNLLEMMSPGITPEHGITRYADDATQGPACAIAAGAATIYRNYLATVGDEEGQTADRQVDCLAPLGERLARALGCEPEHLWEMRNGYALCRGDGLAAIGRHLRAATPSDTDDLRGALLVGLHSDVEVTDVALPEPQTVSQIFCSALPVAYVGNFGADWTPFATLVLEAAYEATMWAAVLNAARGASNVVLLTRLGGGAFGNDDAWIDTAMMRALRLAAGFDLDVRLVSYLGTHPSLRRIAEAFA